VSTRIVMVTFGPITTANDLELATVTALADPRNEYRSTSHRAAGRQVRPSRSQSMTPEDRPCNQVVQTSNVRTLGELDLDVSRTRPQLHLGVEVKPAGVLA
jgi:hypothetical protein